MNYSVFVGIDVSKLKLDIALKDASGQLISNHIIENSHAALDQFLEEVRGEIPLNEMLFCLEPTGHYSNTTVSVLVARECATWLAMPIDIQRSIGMTRGKNDKVDAVRIAEYAYRYSDKARLVSLQNIEMFQIRELLAQRETFVTDKAKYLTQIKDFKGRVSESAFESIELANRMIVEALVDAIAMVEKQLQQLISSSKQLQNQYDLLTTIPGVGKVLAQTLIAATSGFERFNNPRVFACHAGIAPFQYTSGTSIRGRNRVSHRANKRLKSLLHMAALCCIRIKGPLREYYLRKVAEGKSKMAVLNAIRNKIVHCIFAIINRKTPYQNLEVS
jgi:transposase